MLRQLVQICTGIIDIVLPPRKRTVRVRKTHELMPQPRAEKLLGIPVTSLFPYHAPGVEDAIRALKYDGNPRAARLLAAALEDFLREEIASIRSFSPRPVLLVPIPLHQKRRRERGFDQIQKVLSLLPPEFHDGSRKKRVCRICPRYHRTEKTRTTKR
jgi:predicted amidophosphoribosyltransferase